MDRITAKGASDMPTAAKAVGAIAMALLGWAMTEVVHFRHPDVADPGIPHVFFAIVGLFMGVRVMLCGVAWDRPLLLQDHEQDPRCVCEAFD